MNNISVCMATYNGAAFIKAQIESILQQLSPNDELIISDDGSTDETISIIQSFNSNIIKLYRNCFHNHILNFEFALNQASKEYIFLSDQDDVWLPNKVSVMRQHLETCDLVCSNCYITDAALQPNGQNFFEVGNIRKSGFFTNLYKNNFLGCCLAFNRNVLRYALPFPKGLITHDTWIGLCAEIVGTTRFIDEKLIYFRRHNHNTSNTLKGSTLSFYQKIRYRLIILKGLIINLLIR